MDTGANHVIINDAKLINNFQQSTSNVKGIGGSPTLLKGTGNTTFSLTNNDNTSIQLPKMNVVYVPTSPYNLLPPQLLIKCLKEAKYKVDYFHHDDNAYHLKFKQPRSSKLHTISFPIGENGLFHLRTSPGYQKFRHQANANKSWCAFAGSVCETVDSTREDLTTPRPGHSLKPNVITPPASPTTHSPHLSPHGKTREQTSEGHDKTREQTPEGHDKTRESPVKKQPIDITFDPDTESTKILKQAKDTAYQRKQFRLMTIHEQLGHLSFAVLKLMARCGLIPKDLQNVDPLPCPGCAYGKAH